MDAMAFTLILFGARENLRIQKNRCLNETFVSAESLLGKLDSYQVQDEYDEPYEEEVVLDDVTIRRNDCLISCVAEWYELKERTFCVFETRDAYVRGKRFVLEFADGRWILSDDPENEIREKIKNIYVKCNAPDCMEEEVELLDEEFEE